MAWHFGVTTLTGTTPGALGEVQNAYERRLHLPLNGLPTASFRIGLENPMADEIMSRDGDVLLKVYKSGITDPLFVGDLTSAEEVGDEDGKVTLACNFAGPLWRLKKRLCGKSPSGVSFSDTARGTILWSLIDTANTEWDTGIRRGTISTMYATSAGPWSYKPISEAVTELAAARVLPLEIPATHTVRDDFVHTSATYLSDTAHKLDAPSTESWTTPSANEDADDFTINTAGGATRIASGDTLARRPRAGATVFTDVMVSIAWQTQIIHDAGMRQGLHARYVDESNYLVAWMNHSNASIEVVKVIADVATVIGRHTLAGIVTLDTYYNLILQVDADGTFAVWFNLDSTVAKSEGLRIFSQDSDLATGGVLDDGKAGLYDLNGGASGPIRIYANFGASVPTKSLIAQDMSFNFAPFEPTIDGTNPDGSTPEVKIAVLSAGPSLGTDRPNAVFEYGDGSYTSKSYRRALDREGLVNQGFALGTGENAEVVTRLDSASRTRGLFEEVIPADVPGFRQALVDAHVEVRKTPRQIITLEPSAPAPSFGTEYVVGDFVVGRGKVAGTERFNGQFRVYAVDVSIDEEGKETVVPMLVPET